MLLAPEERLGPYEIIAPLGAGGMGQVYRAKDTRLHRTVALKILSPDKIGNETGKRTLVQEARAASALTHPNIAALYDVASDRGIAFIVMEYVAGTPLDRLIGTKALGLSQALQHAIQIADGLAAAHAAGIVHRDIKPANIIVSDQGAVKILDFGLAKLVDTPVRDAQDSTQTIGPGTFERKEGSILGTAPYMSPEQAVGGKVDRRSDIFSFGAVLYELVTGHRAFLGSSALETISAILKADPKPLREIRAGLPADLEKIVQRCLRKDPARRFQYMDDVKVELMELTEDSARSIPIAKPATPWRRYGVLFSLAAVAALAALWFTLARAPTLKAPLAVPLTAYPGSERFPTFSPDGGQVAFSWDGEKEDNFDIYIKLIGTGAPLRITSDSAPDFYPAWSPDGRRIASLRLLANNKAAIMLVPALGGPERKLTEVDLYAQVAYVQGVNPPRIAWSADGAYLIIVDRPSPVNPSGCSHSRSTQARSAGLPLHPITL